MRCASTSNLNYFCATFIVCVVQLTGAAWSARSARFSWLAANSVVTVRNVCAFVRVFACSCLWPFALHCVPEHMMVYNKCEMIYR